MSTRNLVTALAGVALIGAASALARTSAPVVSPPPPVASPSSVTPAADTTESDGVMEVRLAFDQSVVSPDDGDIAALVEVRAADDAVTTRTPVAMTLVIDTSGSMAGSKIAQAREAAVALVRRLEEGDIVSVVAYDNDARTVVAAEPVAGDRSAIIAAIDRLATGGSTCMSCGMQTAYGLVRESPSEFMRRVVVLSDGQANAGDSSRSGLVRIAGAAAEVSTVTSTIGLGSDYDETLMSAVANASSGGYYFLPDASEMAHIFERELRSAETTVARDVVVRLDLADGLTLDATRANGFVASGSGATLRLRQVAAGEIRRFVLPIALSERAAYAPADVRVNVSYVAAHGEGALVAGLAVHRSEDPMLVASSVNASVVAEAEMAKALADAERAMEAVLDGDVDDATRQLDGLVGRLEAQAEETGDSRLIEEAENMRELRSTVAAPGFGSGGEGRGLYLQNAARNFEASSGVAREQMYHADTVY